jgi:phosphatidylinositol alpha-1,6-mannosyltransferase
MPTLHKILFVTHNYPPIKGGISTWAYEISAGLARNGYEVRLLAPVRNLDQAPVDITLVPFSEKPGRKIRRLAIIQSLLQELKRRPDLVFLGSLHPYGLIVVMLCGLFRIPYVLATHGSEVIRILGGQNWMGVQKWTARKTISCADQVFAISRYTAELNLRLIKRKRTIHIIPNGVNFDRFKPSLGKPSRLHEWVHLKQEDPFVILTVGTLTRRKGHLQVIKALQSLKDKYPQIAYLIVGDGAEGDNLKKEVQRLDLNDHIHFLGLFPYSEVLEVYQQADLFILTSRMIVDEKIAGIEGFGIVFLEANACGLPVIGSRVGGIPDAVKDGETGLLVNPEKPAEIAAAIETLILDETLRKKMGLNGIRWAREHDWSKIVSGYIKVLEEAGL